MGPVVNAVVSDTDLPPHADVVVIGGGIIGVSAAMALAERGLSVVVLEKGHVACEQSSRNWGWCRQSRRDPREFALVREALRMWRGMNAKTGLDTGFRSAGILFAARDEALEQKYSDWVKLAAESGIESAMVGTAELKTLLPGDTAPPRAALYCASDGRAEPQWAAPAIALTARRFGATIVTQCASRGIETSASRVSAVVTERGRIACNTVIVAGGAWTRRILKDLGVTLPQLKVRASVARTTPIEGGPETSFWDGDVAIRKRADGGYTIADGSTNVAPITIDSFLFMKDFSPILMMDWPHIKLRVDGRILKEFRESAPVPWDKPSPYEITRVLDPAPDTAFLTTVLKTLGKRYAGFAEARIAQSWAGLIDATPDAVPVISAVDGISGLVVATGFSGHGFGIGPAAGHLAADLATGVSPIVDPYTFRLSRFSDGSNPRPTGGI